MVIAVFSCVLTKQLQHLASYLVCPAQDVIKERKRQDKLKKEKMGEVSDREVLKNRKWLTVVLLENSISPPPPPPADPPMFPPHAPPRLSPPPSLVGVTNLVQRGCAMSWCWRPAPLLVHKVVLGAGEVAAGCSATGALHPAVHADLLQGCCFGWACSDQWWTHWREGGRRLSSTDVCRLGATHTQPRPLKLFLPHI